MMIQPFERAQPFLFNVKGSKRDFYFLLCDPTDGRYLSTGPASCDTICRDYRFCRNIRSLHSPFPLLLLSSSLFFFYFILFLIEGKLNSLEKPPIFDLLRATRLRLPRKFGKRLDDRKIGSGSESRACKLVHVSRYRDFLASNSLP